MEFYAIILIVAAIEVCLLLILHIWIGKKWLTMTLAFLSVIVLLVMGLYNKYHKNATTYKTLSNVKVKTSELYFSFDDDSKARSFCNSQPECTYIIEDKNKYYVATKNNYQTCKNTSPSVSWCGLDNTNFNRNATNTLCYSNNSYTHCVDAQTGSGTCPYKSCDDYYNRIKNCEKCLASPSRTWATEIGKCVSAPSSHSHEILQHGNCADLMDKYGDVPYNSNTATIYSKSCKGNAFHDYKSCSPSEMINTSPLFTNNIEKTCSHTNECMGYVCDERIQNEFCTYLNKNQNAMCCNTNDVDFCLNTKYYCKGKCGNLPNRCAGST